MNSPCSKQRFRTKKKAIAGLGQVQCLNASKGREKRNKRLHVYDCPYCDFWHIGHMSRKFVKAR